MLPAKEQERAFDALRKEGIYQANLQNQTGENNDLLRERVQSKEPTVMCSGCKGFYSKRRINLHKKSCVNRAGVTPTTVNFSTGRQQDVTEEFQNVILDRFRDDDVGNVCRKDKVVLLLGKKLWAKSVKKQKRVIMNEMRLFGNLIVNMKEAAGKENLTGEDVLNRQNFEFLIQAIEKATKTEAEKEKAGLKLSIGYVLKKAVKIMKGCYVQHNMLSQAEEVQRFSEVLTLNWDFVFYAAQLQCELRRNSLRKPDDMPLEQDVLKLREYLVSSMKSMVEDEFLLWDTHNFVVLRNLIVTRLTMFNARRGGEPARMTLQEWQDAESGKWIDPDLVQKIDDPMEQSLVGNFKLAYQAGKGSRRLVPVLVPHDTTDSIRKLVEIREAVGILSDNEFLFPNTGQSEDHVSGWHSICFVTKAMGDRLTKPGLLIADKFRHRASTVFALQDLPEQAREVFYRHMGHSSSINRDVYQSPLAVMELTTVGGFLQLLDNDGKRCSITAEPSGAQNTKKKTSDSTPSCTVTCSDRSVIEPVELEETSEEVSHSAKGMPIETNVSATDESEGTPCSVETSQHQPSLTESNERSSCLPDPQRKRKRGYFQWSSEDTLKVTSFFSSHVQKPGVGSKGSLPGLKEIESFLDENDIFPSVPLAKRQKINLVKTKIFNERKSFRNRKQFEVW